MISQTVAIRTAAFQQAETASHRFELLYRSSRDDLYAYLVTLLGDPSSAEDITALAFERAYRRRRLFNPRRGSERAWLFGIARNAALDELRRRKRNVALLVEPPDGSQAAPQDELEDALALATLRAALASLGPRERELVALKFHAGLSNQEIARVLHVSESNAGTLLHRAITKLRKACDVE